MLELKAINLLVNINNLKMKYIKDKTKSEKIANQINELEKERELLDFFIFLKNSLDSKYKICYQSFDSIAIKIKRKNTFINNIIFGKLNYKKVSLIIKKIINESKYKDYISFYNSNSIYSFILLDSEKSIILDKIQKF